MWVASPPLQEKKVRLVSFASRFDPMSSNVQENSFVEGVASRNPLPDLIDTEPIHSSQLQLERLEDLDGPSEANVLGGL